MTDCTPGVRAAIESAIATKATHFVFSPGEYHFWPNLAFEQYLFVSNHDSGLRRIALPVFDAENLIIDGQGARLIFHGCITPFVLRNCRNVTITQFEIDWVRTFHGEALVLSTGDGYADMEISEQFPFRVEHNALLFLDEDDKPLRTGYTLEFDRNLRQPAFRVSDNFHLRSEAHATQIGPRIVRVRANYTTNPTPGNIMVFQNEERNCAAITIGDSRDIQVSHVTVRHANGMAVIAQRTQDIRVSHLTVTPREGRIISAGGDATHFVNCRGLVEIDNCLAENQMDDFTNVHGIYGRISRRISDYEIEFEVVHNQQLGIDVTDAGDTVEFVRASDLTRSHEGLVSNVNRLNKTFTRLAFTDRIPDKIKPGDAIQSLGWQPDLTIHNCTLRKYRGRGCLITTGGKAIVENNLFQTAGAALTFEGDVSYWFEAGAVRDVLVRNNRFEDCNYGVWGRATIDINPGVKPEYRSGVTFHHNIRVENNLFTTFHNSIVKAHCVDGFTFRGNEIRVSSTYPAWPTSTGPLDITDSRNVVIEDNRIDDALTNI